MCVPISGRLVAVAAVLASLASVEAHISSAFQQADAAALPKTSSIAKIRNEFAYADVAALASERSEAHLREGGAHTVSAKLAVSVLKKHVLTSATDDVYRGADGKEHALDLSKAIIPPLVRPTGTVEVRRKEDLNAGEVKRIVREQEDKAKRKTRPVHHRIRSSVLRALDAYDARIGAGRLGGMSVSALAGAEVVGDEFALQSASTLYDQPFDVADMDDGVGDGDRVVGNINFNGDQVPVYVFSGDGDDANMTIMGIGDVAIGNLSTSRKYIRLLTCSQVASVHNQLVGDAENEVEVCKFVQKHCKPRGGLLNYLELPYCYFDTSPWSGGFFLLLWTGVLFVWLTAQVPFLIPSLSTMSKVCSMSQTVAGVTFLAFGNGCADLFSMLAATLSGPGAYACIYTCRHLVRGLPNRPVVQGGDQRPPCVGPVE